jgi:CRP-like cAMP-binding protein/ABC-type sugar transport system ATPase subunit/predicted double-glycine peptidase
MPQFVAEELAGFLKQTSLFSILDEELIQQLANRATMHRFPLGETIIEEGDAGRFAWLIFSGRVRVLKRSESGRQVTLGTQTVGDLFGEQAILTDSPRSATIRAAEDVVLFRIDRLDFLDALDRSEHLRQYFDSFIQERAVRDFLRTQTFLEKLRATDVTALLDQLEPCEFAADETVIQEGAAADALYIVREGRLKAIRGEAGSQPLGYLSEGDFFGERALLTDEPRSASVIAETATRCFALSRQNFDRLLETAPAVREQLTERFSRYDAANELHRFDRKRANDDPSNAEESSAGQNESPLPARSEERARPNERPVAEAQRTGNQLQNLRDRPRWFQPLPFISQQNESDCGAASLAMVARYFGIRIPLERLRTLAQTGYAGASLYSLAAAASNIGFKPNATRTTLDRLPQIRLPAIAHWEDRHYLVLYRVDSLAGEVVVGDPERGLLKLSRSQFENGWTGRLLLLEPTARLEENVPPDSAFTRCLTSLRNRIPVRLRERSADSPNAESPRNTTRPADTLNGSIQLENVSFQFSPDGRHVLSGINLEISDGQTLAIVGRTGSGKSLLAEVLAGTRAATGGTLLIDGRGTTTGNAGQLSSIADSVTHAPLIPGATIAENIASGSHHDVDVGQTSITAAAQIAEADSFIGRLPFGYDTPMGNGFAELSSGERQQITFARATLADAPLLILDDSLSAPSSQTARRMLLRLRTASVGNANGKEVAASRRTIVVTARNIATTRDADVIAVLDDGNLVETGSHQELMKRDGLYSFLLRERSA